MPLLYKYTNYLVYILHWMHNCWRYFTNIRTIWFTSYIGCIIVAVTLQVYELFGLHLTLDAYLLTLLYKYTNYLVYILHWMHNCCRYFTNIRTIWFTSYIGWKVVRRRGFCTRFVQFIVLLWHFVSLDFNTSENLEYLNIYQWQ